MYRIQNALSDDGSLALPQLTADLRRPYAEGLES